MVVTKVKWLTRAVHPLDSRCHFQTRQNTLKQPFWRRNRHHTQDKCLGLFQQRFSLDEINSTEWLGKTIFSPRGMSIFEGIFQAEIALATEYHMSKLIGQKEHF